MLADMRAWSNRLGVLLGGAGVGVGAGQGVREGEGATVTRASGISVLFRGMEVLAFGGSYKDNEKTKAQVSFPVKRPKCAVPLLLP